MQLGVPLGTMLGYFWKYAFIIQIVALTSCFIFYIFCDNDQISIQNIKEKEDISSIQTIFLQNIKTFCLNPLFVLSMLTLSSLYLVVTGIQFWLTDYLNSVMMMEYDLVYQSFLIISITAPLSGVYLGSMIIDNHLGNQGFRVLKIATIEIFLASISGVLIPIFDNQRIIILLVWCLLFFGSSAIPSMMGIMITSLSQEERSSGNSLSHLFFNLFGYLPASSLYGYVSQVYGSSNSRLGMIMFACINFLALIFLLLGIYKKYNHLKQIYLDLNESEFRNKLHSLSHHSHDYNEEYQKKDFSYMKMQSDNQKKKQKQIIFALQTNQLEADQLSENESPLIIGIETQRIRNVYSIQSTILQISYNFSSLIGRRNLECDLFMIKTDQMRNKSQKSFELQLKVANHFKCEERFVNLQQQ
ncbi:unnamed protein product [Paramecium sonneborni]|uniref:Major facilitator superfamily (MFS) profile domain-containing protein n=1 Tax=Paramecium sonneborni TaxID=65129 RepID=A0A8S1KMM1_9CILI|nr:unnamed protein product [Paramecium sonneborni]